MNKQEIRHKLLTAGVKNLNEFGYQHATTENILRDEVYSMFFKSMLKDTLGKGELLDEVINELLSEIKE